MNPPAYGTNRGFDIDVIHFTVNHLPTVRQSLALLLAKMRHVWEAGQGVLFHCNEGIHRGPAGYAIAMANINHSSIKVELDGLRRFRPQIHHVYRHCFDDGYDINGLYDPKDRQMVQNLRAFDAEISGRRGCQPFDAPLGDVAASRPAAALDYPAIPPATASSPVANWDSKDRDGHSIGNQNWDWSSSNSCSWHWAWNGTGTTRAGIRTGVGPRQEKVMGIGSGCHHEARPANALLRIM